MFCSKCGNELKDGEKFCHECGTKSGTTGNPMNLNMSTEDIMNKASEIRSNVISGVADLGQNKVLILGNIALLVLSFIFSFAKVLDTGVMGISATSMSMFFDEISDDMLGVRAFCTICYLISIISLTFPLLFKKAWKPKFFIPTKIVTILSLIWLLLVSSVMSHQINSSIYGSLSEFSLNATGWLFIVTTIGALILAYKNTFDLKNHLNANPKTTAQSTAQADDAQKID